MKRWQLPAALLLAVAVRSPFWIEALRTPVDGDTAIVGLMAQQPGAGTTLWGQPYGSPLDAWVALPFVAALGPTDAALRLPSFLLGLALVPLAYGLGAALHPAAAFPAAVLLACPPPYLLLLAALPPPLYATTLALCGAVLLLAARLGAALGTAAPVAGRTALGLVLLGALAGLALWTHLMSASTLAAAAGWLLWRARDRKRWLLLPLLALLVASIPYWRRAAVDAQAVRIVSVTTRERTFGEHLAELVPRLHLPLGGLLGTHVPVVADAQDFVLRLPWPAAAALVVLYLGASSLALRAALAPAGRAGPALLLLAAAVLAVLAFPWPQRAGPHTVRFLTPLALPLLVLAAWAPTAGGRPRRAWLVVLGLASLHLGLGARLLESWRGLDRAQAPFLLPDLAPVRELLERRGIRHAYASYGPAYRLTWESGGRLLVSQPWNERFRHYPLPLLDEVRFAKHVAWVLTPEIPSDLPSPPAFEDALGAVGGGFRRTPAGPAVVYHDFVPPFSPLVESWPGGGALGDGDLGTALEPDPVGPTLLRLPEPRALDAITLVAGLEGPRLPRSLDVEVSADGEVFEVVASRRRRQERQDLRWVGGHPQAVLDHDMLPVALHGRSVSAVRLSPHVSSDAWRLAELLLHPAEEPARRAPWDEWLDPHLEWAARARVLAERPRPDRADWYWRLLLVSRQAPLP